MSNLANEYFNITQSDTDINIEEFNTNFFLDQESYLARFDSQDSNLLIPFILKGKQGETTLTIPGLEERDFAFYFRQSITQESFINFVSNLLKNEKPSLVRIPLLTYEIGSALLNLFKRDMNDYEFYLNVSNHTPIIDKTAQDFSVSKSLKRSYRSLDEGKYTKFDAAHMDIGDLIKKYHNQRWGSNRSERFFHYIQELSRQAFTKTIGIKDNKDVFALQLNIQSSNILHYYYGSWDDALKDGIGTMALSASYFEFINNPDLQCFSFGRGAEHYKFRYANAYLKLCEIRGIFSPLKDNIIIS